MRPICVHLKKQTKILTVVCGTGVGLVLGAGLVLAATKGASANYAIDEAVFGGGGTLATAGEVFTNTTAGQTAVAVSTSASYGLETGYWHGGGPVPVTLQHFVVE